MWRKALLSLLWASAALLASCRALVVSQQLCGGGGGGSSGRRLKYVFGDALLDGEDCLGPEGLPYPREEILQLLTDPDSELRGKIFQPSSSVFPSSREGRTLFGGGGDDEAEMMVGLRSRALLEAAKRPEETPSFAESLEIQSRWKRDAAVRDSNSNRNKNPGRNKNNKNSNIKQRVNSNKRKQQQAERPAVREAQAKPAKTTPAAEIKKRTKPTATEAEVVESASSMNSNSSNSSSDDSSSSSNPQCNPENRAPSRLCKTTYNTTAPMYGVSLTSGQPVTIVQKFPDLLQQVVYETCDSKECDLLHGECVQTYVPYLFLVIPLGPVTLTGQDYVLVESGCACRPKYASRADPDPLSVIPNF